MRVFLQKFLLSRGCKPLVFTLCMLPLAYLVYGIFSDTLGANPAEKLVRSTGDWALRFLCLTLAITPLRQMLKMPALARLRRMLGLFSYFYAALHFLCYAWFDKDFVLQDILADTVKRPFILVGMLSLLLLTPLALSSFNRAIKALGAARWRGLHKLVYLIACLVILHFFWMRAGKNDFFEVAVYALIISLLLAYRVHSHFTTKLAKPRAI